MKLAGHLQDVQELFQNFSDVSHREPPSCHRLNPLFKMLSLCCNVYRFRSAAGVVFGGMRVVNYQLENSASKVVIYREN
jgi:hypothetical protein